MDCHSVSTIDPCKGYCLLLGNYLDLSNFPMLNGLEIEWAVLPVGLIVMIANSIYIVCLTAFLMGLAPNKAILIQKS